MSRDKNPFVTFVAYVIVALICLGIFGIRFWIAQGDLGCTFSADPALCATVRDIQQ